MKYSFTDLDGDIKHLILSKSKHKMISGVGQTESSATFENSMHTPLPRCCYNEIGVKNMNERR